MIDITAGLGVAALAILVVLSLWATTLPEDRGEAEHQRFKTPTLYPYGTIVRVKVCDEYLRGIVLYNKMVFAGVMITVLEMIDDETGVSFKAGFPSEEISYWGETEADIAKWRNKHKEFLERRADVLRWNERGNVYEQDARND